MNPESEITAYYNKQFESHKEDIVEVLCKFLGEEYREISTTKVNSLDIIYFVALRDLRLALKNDDMTESEQKMLESFLERILDYNPIAFEKMTIEELINYIEKTQYLLSRERRERFATLKMLFSLRKKYGALSSSIEKMLKETFKHMIESVQNIGLYHYIIGTYGNPENLGGFKYKNCSLGIKDKGVISLPIYPRDLSPDGQFLWAVLNYVRDSIKKEDIDLWHGFY